MDVGGGIAVGVLSRDVSAWIPAFAGMTNSGRRNVENADWMGSTARTKAAKAHFRTNDETGGWSLFRIRVRDLLSYQAGQPPCQPRIRSEQ